MARSRFRLVEVAAVTCKEDRKDEIAQALLFSEELYVYPSMVIAKQTNDRR